VVYRPLYGEGKTWVRPASMWDEVIEVDSNQIRRFELAEEKGPSPRRRELEDAFTALMSTLRKCEKIDAVRLAKAQRTLLERRVAALKIALSLIDEKIRGEHEVDR